MSDSSNKRFEGLVGPGESLRVMSALKRGASRRDVLAMLMAGGMQATLAGSLAGMAVSAHAQTPRRGGRIRVAGATAAATDTLDPAKQSNQTDYSRCNMVYNGLTSLDGSLTPQPALAELFNTKDAKVWVFTLRKGVAFHDGKPLAPADVVVVGPDETRLPPDEVGEIVVESPSLFVGYWGRPDDTGRQLRSGRFFTGDLGHVDGEGFLYVDGRAADLIISGGMNVYPAEVERVLHEHPDVLEAAVVGVPHERWGETVCAVVVPRAGASLTVDVVVEHVAERLAGYKKPTRVVFLTELPRNANAKVVKTRLRASLVDPGAEEVLRFQ